MQSTTRYARQLQLSEIGLDGQTKLASSKVLLIGVGGLGCAVATQLASAGVGELILVDHDTVDESNLHRQHLFREADCGQPKALVAQRALQALNSTITTTAHALRILPSNIQQLGQNVDLIIDAADNFAVAYIASEFSTFSGTPLLSASVNRTYGHVGVFGQNWPSFRAVFPRLPANQQSCDTVGVTGPSVGIIASLQAQEALKVLLGQSTLGGKLLYVDCWNYSTHLVDVAGASEDPMLCVTLIEAEQLNDSDMVVDIRSAEEIKQAPQPFHTHLCIPLSELSTSQALPTDKRIVLACRSGQRAMIGAQSLRQLGLANVVALLPKT